MFSRLRVTPLRAQQRGDVRVTPKFFGQALKRRPKLFELTPHEVDVARTGRAHLKRALTVRHGVVERIAKRAERGIQIAILGQEKCAIVQSCGSLARVPELLRQLQTLAAQFQGLRQIPMEGGIPPPQEQLAQPQRIGGCRFNAAPQLMPKFTCIRQLNVEDKQLRC